MSNPDSIPVPESDAQIEWKTVGLTIDFHPPIKMSRKVGLEFAARVTDCLEPEDVQLDPNEWRLIGGAACEGVEARISKRSIGIRVVEPQNNLEWYEERFQTLLAEFHDTFSPSVALRTRVVLTGLLSLPNNVEVLPFLGGWVMGIHPHKFVAVERPLQILGIRLAFPAFEDDGNEVNWGVDVRIETFSGDSKKLFLEADAQWDNVEQWDADYAVNVTTTRVPQISDFLKDRIIQFLRQPPMPEDEEVDDDEQ